MILLCIRLSNCDKNCSAFYHGLLLTAVSCIVEYTMFIWVVMNAVK